jgi:cytidyltransferase-like protein
MMSDCVLIGGNFDPLHAGHLAYLREASDHGPLLCALSDNPAKHPPLVPLADRAKLLKWLGVETVIIGESIPSVLQSEKPRAYIKGADWRGKLPAEEVAICVKQGIQIIYTETVQNSSSKLLADYERTRNAEKLAALETFIGQQKQADVPWQPVTDYSREARREIEGPHADRIAEVFAGCTVLDVGCGFGYLVELLRERGMSVSGWDPEYCADGTLLRSDLVICREVLEHTTVRDLARTVPELARLSTRFIYVTTRFTEKSHLLDVDGSDHLDPTHISMLNQDLLRTLFVLEGCRRRADLEATLDWKHLGRVLVYEVPA